MQNRTQRHKFNGLVQLSLDVRGKQTLEDSLDLYVQGELMEGDNQYYCEEASQKVHLPSKILAVGLSVLPV